MIPAFVITAAHETDRFANLERLHQQLPGLKKVEAIYPTHIHVPFQEKLQELSLKRTGWRLNSGELGVLLSNRKIWRSILQQASDDDQLFLILESDSVLMDEALVQQLFPRLYGQYDLFFFGAWSGHMQLERSSKQVLEKGYCLGRPFIKSVYGAYGYCVNKKAAAYLLKRTGRISYPVDQYKRFIRLGELRIGGVVPELISHLENDSTIGHPKMGKWRKKLLLWALDAKNALICFFK